MLQNHDELKCCDTSKKLMLILIGKGIALNKTGKHDDAISAYKQVLNIDSQCGFTIESNNIFFKNIPFEKSKAFKALGKTDDAFLAAQGIRLQEAESIKANAKLKNSSVQHVYELKRFYELSRLKDNDSD